jgi:DNA invertase Pin-like site-specific DNA recombinase
VVRGDVNQNLIEPSRPGAERAPSFWPEAPMSDYAPSRPMAQRETPRRIRAAQYLRMSTEHQRYSPENQSDAIAQYAIEKGLEIVRTYQDEGKSGLTLSGRDALGQLLRDVLNGQRDFDLVLVYDVSRWGRFQDTDEGAHYEFVLRRAGVKVRYCAEQFENDGSPFSTVYKSVKRAMAAEYSRELSAKVFRGQSKLAGLGYKQGGPALFGYRRLLLDERNRPKFVLQFGQRKSLQTDRVTFCVGDPAAVKAVRRVFSWFLAGVNTSEIARRLTAKGSPTPGKRPWSYRQVIEILRNEAYAGTCVYNRRSHKLAVELVQNPPEAWIRAPGAFPALVTPEVFERAQILLGARTCEMSDEDFLNALRDLWRRKGRLSKSVIDADPDTPSVPSYVKRFGGLTRAYAAVGHCIEPRYQGHGAGVRLQALKATLLQQIVARFQSVGAEVVVRRTGLLEVNQDFSFVLLLVRCERSYSGHPVWRVCRKSAVRPDFVVIAQMDAENEHVGGYFIVPGREMDWPKLRLQQRNLDVLNPYRTEHLGPLIERGALALCPAP